MCIAVVPHADRLTPVGFPHAYPVDVVDKSQFNAAIPDYFTDFPMVMFMISGVLLSEAGHTVSLDDRARVAETRYVTSNENNKMCVCNYYCVCANRF